MTYEFAIKAWAMRFRVWIAWASVAPLFVIYYLATVMLILILFIGCGYFRLLLGPNPQISNCVLWGGWKWISETWINKAHKPGTGPGGYLVIRWSGWSLFKWLPFVHIGWMAASDEVESFVPDDHIRRIFPPALFVGKRQTGS